MGVVSCAAMLKAASSEEASSVNLLSILVSRFIVSLFLYIQLYVDTAKRSNARCSVPRRIKFQNVVSHILSLYRNIVGFLLLTLFAFCCVCRAVASVVPNAVAVSLINRFCCPSLSCQYLL